MRSTRLVARRRRAADCVWRANCRGRDQTTSAAARRQSPRQDFDRPLLTNHQIGKKDANARPFVGSSIDDYHIAVFVSRGAAGDCAQNVAAFVESKRSIEGGRRENR